MWIKRAAFLFSAALLLFTAPASALEGADAGVDILILPQSDVTYKTYQAEVGALSRTMNFECFPTASQGAAIRAQEKAVVKQVHFKSGDMVEKGDVLAEFSVEPNEIAVSELELAYERAEESLNRDLAALADSLGREREELKRLKTDRFTREKTIQAQELKIEIIEVNIAYTKDRGERQLASRREEIAKLREKSTDYVITAPISGQISSVRYINVGDEVSHNELIAILYDRTEILMGVYSFNLDQLRYDMPVELLISSGRDSYSVSGRVVSNTSLLEEKADEQRALISIDDGARFLELIGSASRLGSFRYYAKITLPYSDNAILVPRTAITYEGSSSFVYILEDGQRKKRYVLTGMSDASSIQILDGIESGTQVIV